MGWANVALAPNCVLGTSPLTQLTIIRNMSGKEEPSTPGEEQLSIRVVAADGGAVYFKVKPRTSLKKLMDAYCKRAGVVRESVRFLVDGDRIKEDDTPETLGLENEDSIDAVIAQVGGY